MIIEKIDGNRQYSEIHLGEFFGYQGEVWLKLDSAGEGNAVRVTGQFFSNNQRLRWRYIEPTELVKELKKVSFLFT